jgi:hypothetical protein
LKTASGHVAIISYRLLAINNYLIATSDVLDQEEVGRFGARGVRGPLTIGVVVWYFFASMKGKRFYAGSDEVS